ncbi:hypothetical protein BGX28_004713 [Mortierella sp. GBA30]|nr:hypothetical protein BGX28_004713 [Mortierella sp. GBA30]
MSNPPPKVLIVGAGLGGLMMALLLEKAKIPYVVPELCDLMLAQIPADNIHFGKKVLSLQQNEHGAMLRFADGTTHHGDIIVGADGAYSGVRQSLYKELQRKGELPKADKEDLSLNYLCMVGTTDPMDSVKYPMLKDPFAHLTQLIGDSSPYSWTTITVPGNKMCWSVVKQLPNTTVAKDTMFRNSEWGPESNEDTINDVKQLPNGLGGTMEELINATSQDRISKVMLEEKLFETWQHGRTALIGDACHKMLPSAGQGAMNAMQDAVILANCLYDLESLTPEAINAALKDYQEQRFEHAKFQYETSKINGRIMSGQVRLSRLIYFARIL